MNRIANLPKWGLFIIAMMLIASLSLASIQMSQAASSSVITTADTYANGSAPSTNYGSSCCDAAGGKAPYVLYLRFVVPANVSAATLNLNVSSQSVAGSTSTFTVAETNDSWSESTLTYNNRPSVSSTVLGTFTGATVSGKVSVKLANASNLSNREVTLAIKGGTDAAWFWSREKGTSKAPSLALTTGTVSSPLVGVLGDSISEGCCSSASTTFQAVPTPFWQETANILGWSISGVDAQGGTGYLSAGTISGLQPYTNRIGPFLDAHPNLQALLIEGGGNDPATDTQALTTAVNTTFDTIKSKDPSLKVYVLGPYSPGGTGYDTQRTIISQAASTHGFIYIDQVAEQWMTGRSDLLWSDNFHPNENGHILLGKRLAGDLGILGCGKGCLP